MSTIEEAGMFAPKDGVMSESDKILALMEDCPVGNTITYSDLHRVLGRSFESNRNPWYVAAKRFVRLHPGGGVFKTVNTVGYQKVSDWDGVEEQVHKRRKKAARQVRTGKNSIAGADPARMSPDEKRKMVELSTRMGVLESAMRSTKRDLTLVKRQVDTKADASVVDDLMAEVARLAAKVDKT